MAGITNVSSNSPITQDSLFLKLPEEIQINIFTYLDARSLNRAGLTCRQLRQLRQEESLWKRLCIQAGFPLTSVHVEIPKDCSWKIYCECLQKHFPGKGAVFKRDPEKDWSARYYGERSSLMRELEFTSETEGSFLKRFELMGYKDGTFALRCHLAAEETSTLEKYFASLNLVTKQDALFYGIPILYFRDSEDIIKIFLILATYNEIPKEDQALMWRIVSSKDWRQATPLTEKEINEL